MTTIELRRLALGDLSAIEEIERRSYPTPWSRSMFAGELAKPSSICLGAFDDDGEDGALVGYLIVSRYVDAWHVMNVAVDPEHRRRGIATMLLERLFELTADDARRGYTLEVRVSNATRDRALRAARLPGARHPARLLHRQPRGRADHVEGPGRALSDAVSRVILGIETSCDETAAALVTDDGEIRANVVASQAELHARFGGVVPEVASRRHLELVAPVVREALGAGGRDARRRRPRRRHAGAGADRRAARRPRRREGARVVAAAAARAGRPPARPRRLALPRSRTPLEPPFLCLLASGGHTLLLDVRDRTREHRRARHDARRRGRRGVRQGRAAARPRLPGRRGDRPARAATAIPRRTTSRSRACPGSTSRSRASRRRCSTRRATSRRTSSSGARADLAASLPAGDRPRARRADAAAAEQTGARADRRRRRRRGELGAARARSPTPRSRRSRSAPTTRR